MSHRRSPAALLGLAVTLSLAAGCSSPEREGLRLHLRSADRERAETWDPGRTALILSLIHI